MHILTASPSPAPAAAFIAPVTFSQGGSFGVVGAAEQRTPLLFAPRGVACRPCEGDRVLLLPVGGNSVCAGTLSAPGELAYGELRLFSEGGAQIDLKNSGDIVLNGVTITKNGEIITPPAQGG